MVNFLPPLLNNRALFRTKLNLVKLTYQALKRGLTNTLRAGNNRTDIDVELISNKEVRDSGFGCCFSLKNGCYLGKGSDEMSRKSSGKQILSPV